MQDYQRWQPNYSSPVRSYFENLPNCALNLSDCIFERSATVGGEFDRVGGCSVVDQRGVGKPGEEAVGQQDSGSSYLIVRLVGGQTADTGGQLCEGDGGRLLIKLGERPAQREIRGGTQEDSGELGFGIDLPSKRAVVRATVGLGCACGVHQQLSMSPQPPKQCELID